METSSCLPANPDMHSASASPPAADALSIQAKARRHPRLPIFTEPRFWTDIHLELLCCTFTECRPLRAVTMSLGLPNSGSRHFQHFFFDRAWLSREMSLASLLHYPDGPLSSCRNIYLHVGGYAPSQFPCYWFYLRKDCDSDNIRLTLPIAAILDRKHVTTLQREKLFNYPRFSWAVASIAKIKLKKLVPSQKLHDPYLVAFMIALAQRQWRALMAKKTRQIAGVIPRIFYIPEGSDDVYLYSAQVSSLFIKMFEDPTMTPPEPQSLSIQITHIPTQPIETLRERLFGLLFSAAHLNEVAESENLVSYT